MKTVTTFKLRTHRRTRHLAGAAAIAIGIASLTLPAAAHAQTAPRSYAIEAQDLGDALRAFAVESGVDVVFDPTLVKGKRSRKLDGKYDARQGLARLIAGSGLALKATASGGYAITPGEPGVAGGGDGAAANGENAREKGGNGQSEPTTNLPQTLEAAAAHATEIVVTGSRLPGNSNNGPHEVRTYDSKAIERTGQTSIAGFLNNLTSVSTATTEKGQTFGGATSVNLRGLPFGTTLVLLNGRRLQTSGAQAQTDVFDLNNIPLSAVDRIEVVADGASAIYGSDAIAGVINIIVKRDFKGFRADINYGFAKGYSETRASLAVGGEVGNLKGSLLLTYQDRNDLNTSERRLTANNNYQSFGGPNANFQVCERANVFSRGGSLPGGGSATFAAYAGSGGSSPTRSEFSYGTLNECGLLVGSSLIPASRRYGAFASVSWQVAPQTELYAELLASQVNNSQLLNDPLLFGTAASQTYTLGSANPYNPFGTTLGLTLKAPVRSGQFLHSSFVRPLLGARGNIAAWRWEIAAWQGDERSSNRLLNGITDSVGLQTALNASNPSTAINPFSGSAAQFDPYFSDGLAKYASRSRSVEATVNGPLFALPAGDVQIGLGAGHYNDRLSNNFINFPGIAPNTASAFSRNVEALFTELKVPILAGRESARHDLLTVTLATRYDHYSDFGSTTNSQAGVEFRPTSALLLRGTIAEAFKAPSLRDLYQATLTTTVAVTDPISGQRVLVSNTTGGNPSLRPMGGRSWTLGATFAGDQIPGLKVSATRWSVRESDAIQTVSQQFIVNNESAFPGRVVRGPGGAIVSVNATRTNFGSIRVAGFDLLAEYRAKTLDGELMTSFTATRVDRYRASLVPGGAAVNALGVAQVSGNWAPKWKAVGVLDWQAAQFGAGITAHYTSDYRDYGRARRIGDIWILDANARIAIRKSDAARSKSGLELQFGAVNLFNRMPSYSNFSNSLLGYDPTQADIRGRYLYARAAVQW